MYDFQHYNEIAKLITMEVCEELSPEDMLKLKAWVNECPENHRFYSHIKDSTNFKVRNIEYQKIDVKSGWKALFLLIKKKQKLIVLNKILRSVALTVLPLLIAGRIIILPASRPANQEQILIAHTNKIQDGSTKVVSILNDWESVLLDSGNNLSIRVKNRTVIENSDSKLNYSNPTNEETIQLIYNILNITRGIMVLADSTRVYLNTRTV